MLPVEYPYGGPVGSKDWAPNSPSGAIDFSPRNGIHSVFLLLSCTWPALAFGASVGRLFTSHASVPRAVNRLYRHPLTPQRRLSRAVGARVTLRRAGRRS